MKEVVKDMWLQALRSGHYKQGKGYLCSDGEYCCLGVLCDIAAMHGIIVKEKLDYYGNFNEVLPKKVMKWAGLEDENPTVLFEDCDVNLAELNDGISCSFKSIANIIEKQI